ncbi:hypothetical protein MKA27_17795 [[Clostridium] innocuum]|nr:hypothetical protein [[Clostridium] innocuum]MCR0370902.1 hypothetical protein [[Clostridium] innocuum]MCR0375644.1 hypothetical protein [[Clostridium] innocuum]MCR0603652.1 hypothetical protein [[Clostridium] innocuum]
MKKILSVVFCSLLAFSMNGFTGLSWCFAYVTATALRIKGKNTSASTIAKKFNLGTKEGLTISQAKEYCKSKGVTLRGWYKGTISDSELHGSLRGYHPVVGWFNITNGAQKGVGHALLIHGINGNKRLIWNPWNKYSEWTSASSYTASDGTKMSAYRYGIYY